MLTTIKVMQMVLINAERKSVANHVFPSSRLVLFAYDEP
jgi:hypothetical protein